VAPLLHSRVSPALMAISSSCSPRVNRTNSTIPLWVVSAVHACRSWPRRDEASLEEDMKTFLGEMMVVGEHFCHSFASHRLHGDAIGQAVFLVRAGFVKGQGIEK
jgi:hypothetical protein